MTHLDTKAENAWCLYDWAISAWSITIITFIFSSYFAKSIAPNSEQGMILWGNMLTFSGILIAIISPIFGSIADESKNALNWLRVTTLITCLCASLLWFATPNYTSPIHFLIVISIGSIGFELSQMFYNTLLSEVSDNSTILKTSSKGWSLGYFGGLTCLALVLLIFLNNSHSLIKMKQSTYQHVRIVGPFVGAWIFFFSIPLLKLRSKCKSVSINFSKFTQSMKKVGKTAIRLRKNHNTLFHFLIARSLYADGLITVTSFTGIISVAIFNLPLSSLLILGIATNISSAIGSIFCTKFSSNNIKTLLSLSLIGMMASITMVSITYSVSTFWGACLIFSTFAGALQSLCRSYMSIITPEEFRAEMFGFYKLAGKSTCFMGPMMMSTVLYFTHNHRLAVFLVNVFFALGLFLLRRLDMETHISNITNNKLAITS